MHPPPCYLTHSSFAEARLLPAWATCRAFTVGKTSLHENASLAKRGIARTDDNHSQRRMENALTVSRRAHTQILPFKCGLHRWGDDRPLSQDSPFAIAVLLLPPPFHAPVPTRSTLLPGREGATPTASRTTPLLSCRVAHICTIPKYFDFMATYSSETSLLLPGKPTYTHSSLVSLSPDDYLLTSP